MAHRVTAAEMVWVDSTARPAWQQMAIDLAMVSAARRDEICILRLYRWQHNTVTLGANEAAARTWDRAKLVADGIPCVRRPTGGRAVWHASDDLTYSWAGPSGGTGGAKLIYRELHQRLGRAVAALGLNTTQAPTPTSRSDLRPGACFDQAVGGELLAGGRKLLGSAQKVSGDHLLQHGAFSRFDHRGLLDRYRLSRPGAARSSQDVGLPEATELIAAIADSWVLQGATEARDELTSGLEQASVQHEERFGDPAWTWRR